MHPAHTPRLQCPAARTPRLQYQTKKAACVEKCRGVRPLQGRGRQRRRRWQADMVDRRGSTAREENEVTVIVDVVEHNLYRARVLPQCAQDGRRVPKGVHSLEGGVC